MWRGAPCHLTNREPRAHCGECLLWKDPAEAGWKVSRSAPKEPRMDAIWRVPGRAYQVARDPERLLIEERAEALSAAGYPLPGDDPAMCTLSKG